MHVRRLVAAGVVLVTFVGIGGRVDAHGSEWTRFRYHATGVGGTDVPLSTVCDTAANCIVLQSSSGGVYGGDLVTGDGVQGNSFMLTGTNVLAFMELSTFVGTERHCGTGSVVLTEQGVVPDFDSTAPIPFRWAIVPGTGTGDFVGMTGGGTGTAEGDVSTVDGWLRCHAPGDR